MAEPLGAGAAQAPGVLDIGDRKQLFLDEGLIERSEGVRLTMHRPRRDGRVLLAPDAPWEVDRQIGLYCSIIREGDRFRLWYFLSSDRLRCLSYAESPDGLDFEKPILGLHELDGSRQNNVVIPGPDGGGCVWIDPHAPTGERYRNQTKCYPGWPDGKIPTEYHRYASPDGLHWERRPDALDKPFDTQSICLWDQRIGRYVLYTRNWVHPGDPHLSYRTVRRLESDDLEHWDSQTSVMEADARDLATHQTSTGQPPVDYYGADVFKYPGAGDLYVMLSQAYWHWAERPPEEQWGESGDPRRVVIRRLAPAAIDVRLAWSRDGINFDRAGGREPFMELGPEGRWDSRMVWALPDPIPVGDELWIYYAGTNRDHDGFVDPCSDGLLSGMGRAVLRLDGFVSADAAYGAGEIITRPLVFEGSVLELNVETSGGGALRVEIQEASGRQVEGFTAKDSAPLCCNSVRAQATWAGGSDLGRLAGRPVRLRFVMRDCRLYAFRFRS